MTNRIDIQEFINNAPENIVGSLNHPEAVTADMLDNIPHRYSSNLVVQYWLQVEKEDTVMRLLIDNKIAKYLGCTEEYLYYHACKNIGTPVVKNIIDMMSSMVYTVNRTALEPKDILSDNVYVWDREKKKLIVY